MKKIARTLLLLGVGGFAATLVMYWFNLDNKAIYYVVRPVLDKIYNKQKRDVKI